MTATTTTPRTEPDDRATASFDRKLIVPMILGAILNPVNSSLIAVALVPIGIALGAPPPQTAWLVSGLYLATAVGQPVVGRLIDLYGPRRLYLAGSAAIGVGGVVGALAPSLWVLVVARVLIGLGTCAGYPAAMSLLRSEADRTGTDSPAGVLSVLSVATQTIAVIGPTLGGFLIGVGGWRMTFTVNVPLALACVLLGALRLPRTPREQPSDEHSGDEHPGRERPAHEPSRGRFLRAIDPVGIALFVVTLISLLLFLMRPGLTHAVLLAPAALAAAGLVWWERRAADPFLDVRILGSNRPLILTYIRALLTAAVSYSVLYGFTQWLEGGRGLSPTTAGLVLLPIFATGIGIVALTGRRPQVRGKLVVGALGQVVLAALMLLLGTTSPLVVIVVVALVAGIPQGLNNLAVQNSVYHQAEPERVGSSAGLMRTFFYLGAIGSSSAGGLAFAHGATTAGLHDLALFMLGAAILLVVVTVGDRSLRHVVPTS